MRQISRRYVSTLAAVALLLMPLVAGRAQAQERFVRQGTRMVLRLDTFLSSRDNQPGDPFTATVVQPIRYEGAIVRGHIARIEPSGRFSGRTEMGLAFDSIELPNRYSLSRDTDADLRYSDQRYSDRELSENRTVPFDADLIEVIQSDHVQMVDQEGDILSGSRGNQAIRRSGIGALAGGLLGGGRGAVIGLLAGGA